MTKVVKQRNKSKALQYTKDVTNFHMKEGPSLFYLRQPVYYVLSSSLLFSTTLNGDLLNATSAVVVVFKQQSNAQIVQPSVTNNMIAIILINLPDDSI